MAKTSFPFFTKEWLTSTAEMTPFQKGIYIDLLAYQHQNGSIPSETEKIADLVRVDRVVFCEAWGIIGAKFEPRGDRLVNKKLESLMKDKRTNGSSLVPAPIPEWARNFKNYHFDIIYPFEHPEFGRLWDLWIAYRTERHLPSYKPIGEQGALRKLGEMSNTDINTAIEIVRQSIDNNWQGLFELKPNGKQGRTIQGSFSLLDELAERIYPGTQRF